VSALDLSKKISERGYPVQNRTHGRASVWTTSAQLGGGGGDKKMDLGLRGGEKKDDEV